MQIDRLIEAIRLHKNPTALGLDTRIEYIPESFARPHMESGGAASAVCAFNRELLRALRDIIPCVKIQIAYYELMGNDGMICLKNTIDEARRLGYVLIIDAKRGDIGATAEAYSSAYLGESAPYAADFLTVNPYFGSDGVTPFISDCERTGRGIFALVKTSNKSGGEFQDIETSDGSKVYERVAMRVSEWGKSTIGTWGYSSVGAVVGATYPEQGAELREKMPHTFFLLPGYGAQGASASHLAGCFDASGSGAVVAASRSLICAHKKTGTDDFVSASRSEAIRMKTEISEVLSGHIR
ncbi:MAG: orotidine-5'-phosphate decarboxylase [Synergistaceae bacterium]|jgi:orotidine-5'-phosphate decarboxylase|nr:orotidine-5'-phosphate decarboxylase [Synergistaceae bacterium]